MVPWRNWMRDPFYQAMGMFLGWLALWTLFYWCV